MKNFFFRLIILVIVLSAVIAIANSRFYFFPFSTIMLFTIVSLSTTLSLWVIQNKFENNSASSRYLILAVIFCMAIGLIIWKYFYPFLFNYLHSKILNGLAAFLGFILLYGLFSKPSTSTALPLKKRKLLFRIVLPLSILIGTTAWMWQNRVLSEVSEEKTYSILWILIGVSFIILALSILDLILNKILTWKKHPGLRFFLQMILGTALSLLCLNFSYDIIRNYYTTAAPDSNQLLLMNIYGSALILPIFSLYFGYQFLKDWRRSELESEQLMKENARSQMMTLKNHLDPHFLFNNLNILSSLMDKDVELSKEYLDKFAAVYRIILKAEHSDLTLLEEEMQLLDAYVYLLKIRFGESVVFHIDVGQEHMDKGIPPLSLQMLIENAIKHNMASKQSPVKIKVQTTEHEIIVENNIQKKKYMRQDHAGSGLENIKSRYAFFSERPMKVEQTKDTFRVTLPLIHIEHD